ncbi:Transcription factor bHLH96 like [Actinidia chinensis var. chinensis]|uniref:Transcription factor bHLH96 like n=1 Tax=Actinidia chinensis var. chinensis TaxID=1590841 RepID=A0A2R6RDB2_ACTCC|nr:Transcription factor bHLH96 like [Actinidia chinensis var. chinensis]
MALEAVVLQQDPFTKDLYPIGDTTVGGSHSYGLGFEEVHLFYGYCTSDGADAGGFPQEGSPVLAQGRRKRKRRTRGMKNKEEMERQRMTHIVVERNRRKRINHYLAVLRSLMPPSYAQRGDQASIVGGAINFVKELEQRVQCLEAHKQLDSPLFANFFTFPQYSTRSTWHDDPVMTGCDSEAAIEVNMVETHANIKIVSRRQPKQVSKMVVWFHSRGLTILHLMVTTVEPMVLYSFSVKVEDDCQLSTVNEIATTVHEMMSKIQVESSEIPIAI